MNPSIKGLSTAVLLLIAAAAASDAGLSAKEARILEGPPVMRMNAGYLEIRNDGGSDEVLTGARSPRFGRIEFHSTRLSDGMATMVPEQVVSIAAGTSIIFAPGGRHLMLMQPIAPPRAGEIIPIEFEFASGARLQVDFPVVSPAGDTADTGSSHLH